MSDQRINRVGRTVRAAGGTRVDLTSNLLGRWFISATGNDQSGNGNNMTMTTPTYDTGHIGSALVAGSGTTTNAITGLTDDPMTLSLWLRLGTGSEGNPVSWDGSVLDVPFIHVADLGLGFGAPEELFSSLNAADTFEHVAVVVSGGIYQAYVNGIHIGSMADALSDNWSTEDFRAGLLVGTSTAINDVRVYGRALNQVEITALSRT